MVIHVDLTWSVCNVSAGRCHITKACTTAAMRLYAAITVAICLFLAQANGQYEESLRQARKVLKELNKWTKHDVRKKTELLANIHSCLGNGYLETGDYNKALNHHTTDYDLATEQ